jgi:hypothetical protein
MFQIRSRRVRAQPWPEEEIIRECAISFLWGCRNQAQWWIKVQLLA